MSLKFDVALKEISVTLKEEDGEHEYFLREMTGAQREKFNESFKMKLQLENKQIKAYSDKNFKMPSASFLLSLCLYNSEGNLVPISKIREWPNTVLESLSNEAITLSGLDSKSADEEKNA